MTPHLPPFDPVTHRAPRENKPVTGTNHRRGENIPVAGTNYPARCVTGGWSLSLPTLSSWGPWGTPRLCYSGITGYRLTDERPRLSVVKAVDDNIQIYNVHTICRCTSLRARPCRLQTSPWMLRATMWMLRAT
eukprot:1179825-Prorocentrum_minimum.AAC.1